jgi:hypothetical protein
MTTFRAGAASLPWAAAHVADDRLHPPALRGARLRPAARVGAIALERGDA